MRQGERERHAQNGKGEKQIINKRPLLKFELSCNKEFYSVSFKLFQYFICQP